MLWELSKNLQIMTAGVNVCKKKKHANINNALQVSIENDGIRQNSDGSNMKCRVNELLPPLQKHLVLSSTKQEDGIIIEDDFGLAHSPLQRFSNNGDGLTNLFENEVLRSPKSLILDLEPFSDNFVERYGKIDDCHSPLPSTVLGIISTPMEPEEKKLDETLLTHETKNSSRKQCFQTTTGIHQPNYFKSRPVENGVFVVNHRSVMTPAFSSRNMTAHQRPLREDNENHSRVFKRKRSFSEEHESNWNATKSFSSNSKFNSEISCRCTKTMCLKLYCECFQSGKVCREHCECTECKNTLEESGPTGVRTRMIRSILKRKPNAFHKRRQHRGTSCACKSSKCLKKYCQCYVHGRDCHENCECQDCHNRDSLRQRHAQRGDYNGVIESKIESVQIWHDDDSTYSSSHSNNLDKLDALIECKPSSSLNFDEGGHDNVSPKRRGSRDPEGYTTLPPTSMVQASRIPPPVIPDVFRNAKSHSYAKHALPPRDIPIPEVFQNTAPSGSVPPDVFTNPNYWLPWTSSSSSMTSSALRRKGPTSSTTCNAWPR